MKHHLSLTDDGRFKLTCSPRYRDFAASVPGLRFDKASETWQSPASLAVAHSLRGVFGADLEIDPEVFDAVRQEAGLDAHVQSIKDNPGSSPRYARHGRVVPAAT